jgi:hypothetical protein
LPFATASDADCSRNPSRQRVPSPDSVSQNDLPIRKWRQSGDCVLILLAQCFGRCRRISDCCRRHKTFTPTTKPTGGKPRKMLSARPLQKVTTGSRSAMLRDGPGNGPSGWSNWLSASGSQKALSSKRALSIGGNRLILLLIDRDQPLNVPSVALHVSNLAV